MRSYKAIINVKRTLPEPTARVMRVTLEAHSELAAVSAAYCAAGKLGYDITDMQLSEV